MRRKKSVRADRSQPNQIYVDQTNINWAVNTIWHTEKGILWIPWITPKRVVCLFG